MFENIHEKKTRKLFIKTPNIIVNIDNGFNQDLWDAFGRGLRGLKPMASYIAGH